ncbi:RagB/SusD family nutrient uptake outer membrane protein [Chitinophaga vietnamensis]|uniref:RagB/SusD family nutrient uptake outer membrane protein n=1 Tax=Chitinophaga vietnamensis TaxID=2593957 RepID=UPI001177E67B|nr:RagB/SusD family nutrient uptake outer membrane protein [Chitinophaga vietnamensis]
MKNNLLHTKTIFTALCLSACMAMTSGCKKYLEQAPDNRTQLDSPDKVAQLLTAAYPNQDYITLMESMSDNSGNRQSAASSSVGELRVNENPYRYIDFASDAQGSADSYWQACYYAIAAANQAIDACDKAGNAAGYTPYKGEALMARAYNHFMLVSLFAKAYDPATAANDPGVPYVTSPETTLFRHYERKTVAYVYDMIDKDITAAIPLLDDNAYKVPAFHFTKAAAHAFATRFYLFMKQYDKVLAHANQAFPGSTINSFIRQLNTAYTGYTLNEYQNMYTSSQEKANLLIATANSVWARGDRGYQFGLNQALVQQMLYSPNVTGGTWTYANLTYYWGSDPNRRGAGKFLEKFIYTSADIGNPYIFVPLLTAEEVLFNRAEANIQLGNNDAALTDLNSFIATRVQNYSKGVQDLSVAKATKFYKTQDAKQAMINALLDMKRVEFLQEGLRWFDILRYKLPVTHIDNNGAVITLSANDPRRVVQIPQSAQAAGVPANQR